MLLGNLLFVLGVPVALVQLYRSYGGTSVGTKYAGLDGANLRARRGDITGAIGAYQKILERVPVTAGVKYNIGTAFVQQNQLEEAAQMFEYSLADCSNYAPSASALAQCYTTLGAEEKLARSEESEVQAEIRRLERENAILRQEREILKKALSIFSQAQR